MKVEELEEFKKDLVRLSRNFKSLPDDVGVVKKILAIAPVEGPPYAFKINFPDVSRCTIHAIKIACKSLKGTGLESQIRIVYAWFKNEERIVLTEIYYGQDKLTEDRKRLISRFQ